MEEDIKQMHTLRCCCYVLCVFVTFSALLLRSLRCLARLGRNAEMPKCRNAETPNESVSNPDPFPRATYRPSKFQCEISEITKIPLGTVKSRIRLALEKIRGKLEQDGTMADLNASNESSMIN